MGKAEEKGSILSSSSPTGCGYNYAHDERDFPGDCPEDVGHL